MKKYGKQINNRQKRLGTHWHLSAIQSLAEGFKECASANYVCYMSVLE